MNIIGLLIILVLFCLLIWAAQRLMAGFGIGEPISSVIYVVIVIFFVLAIIQQIGYGPTIPIIK